MLTSCQKCHCPGGDGALTVGDASIASAAIRYDYRIEEFTFGSSERTYKCRLEVSSVVDAENNAASSTTSLLRDGSDPLCFDSYHQVFVTGTYTDVNGDQERVTAQSADNVTISFSDFASGYVGEHRAVFEACRCDTPVYRTAPK